jgi:hypothetical protein
MPFASGTIGANGFVDFWCMGYQDAHALIQTPFRVEMYPPGAPMFEFFVVAGLNFAVRVNDPEQWVTSQCTLPTYAAASNIPGEPNPVDWPATGSEAYADQEITGIQLLPIPQVSAGGEFLLALRTPAAVEAKVGIEFLYQMRLKGYGARCTVSADAWLSVSSEGEFAQDSFSDARQGSLRAIALFADRTTPLLLLGIFFGNVKSAILWRITASGGSQVCVSTIASVDAGDAWAAIKTDVFKDWSELRVVRVLPLWPWR